MHLHKLFGLFDFGIFLRVKIPLDIQQETYKLTDPQLFKQVRFLFLVLLVMVLVWADGFVAFKRKLLLFIKLSQTFLVLGGLELDQFVGNFLFLLDRFNKVLFLVDWLLSDRCALAQNLYFLLLSLKCLLKLKCLLFEVQIHLFQLVLHILQNLLLVSWPLSLCLHLLDFLLDLSIHLLCGFSGGQAFSLLFQL